MSNPTPVYVLDSYAFLTLLSDEAGAARVQKLLHQAEQGSNRIWLSEINLGEILHITERAHGMVRAQEVLAAIDQLPVELLPTDRARVLAAAHIKANYPVAYADAFAIAATLELDAIALTGDPEFRAVSDLIRIEWL